MGEKLAFELPPFSEEDRFTHITRVTPTVMRIELTHEAIGKGLKKLKADKACGPDKVAPRLLKSAGDTIIPSLMSLYTLSASRNLVPDKWKAATVSPLYKKDDETDKHNYRPISLLCVPGKLMESSVASIVTTRVKDHDLISSQQWAYRKSHSTELLLVKMTEAWRHALDRKLVVGVVFVDFRKAFDSISHPVLLHKLQGLGIAGDIWLWIKDYLTNRSQMTIVNGCASEAMPVRFGVPQGSVLDPTLFSLFCNDLPDIADDGEGEICMYADDTTIYAAAPTPDRVAVYLITF